MVDKAKNELDSAAVNASEARNIQNEERIRVWREKRKLEADIASKERLEKAELERQERIVKAEIDREKRVEQFRLDRQLQIESSENEKRAEALRKLPDENTINTAHLAIITKQRLQARSFLKRVFAFILLPTVLVFLYVAIFATPLYEAESVVTVKTNEQNVGVSGLSASLIGSSSGGLLQNIFSAREYILSRKMMDRMEEEQGFVSYFKTNDIDYFSRPFSNKITNADESEYYQRRVKVAVDIQEGVLKIKVQAKNPADAERFSNVLLSYVEAWVNDLSERMILDKSLDAKQKLKASEQELQDVRRKLVDLQIANGDLSPRDTMASTYASINDVGIKIKDAEREIGVYKKAGVGSSPVVKRLKERLSVLFQQQADLKQRLVGNGDKALNNVLSNFEKLTLEKDIAQQKWESALRNVEQVNAEAFKQRQYFLTIVPPTASVMPAEPKKFMVVLLSLLVLSGLYGLVTVLMSILRTNSRP